MNRLFRIIQRFSVLVAFFLFLFTTLFCWYVFGKYKNTNIFYFSNIIYIVCAFLLLSAAVTYRDFKVKNALLLSAASFLIALAFIDFYLITFRYDTSGPGGENVITHRHWYNKFVSNNEYGFWERSIAVIGDPRQRDDQCIIAVVGDSFTWGQGLPGRKFRFTEKLEQRLNSLPGVGKITVLNFGKGGADTVEETQIVNNVIANIHPNIVLICYLSNDIDSDSFSNYCHDCNTFAEKISTITPVVNFIYWRLTGLSKYQNIGMKYLEGLIGFYNNPETFKRHMNQLERLFKDVEKIGAQPIFVLLPFPHMWKPFPTSIRDEVYNRIKRSVADAGVPIIDLSWIENKYTLEEFQVNSFDGHPNEDMHEEFANAIFSWFANNSNYIGLLK